MGNAVVVVNLLLALLDRSSKIGELIKRAQAENRDVTNEELDQLAAEDDTAKAELQAAIEKARGGGG